MVRSSFRGLKSFASFRNDVFFQNESFNERIFYKSKQNVLYIFFYIIINRISAALRTGTQNLEKEIMLKKWRGGNNIKLDATIYTPGRLNKNFFPFQPDSDIFIYVYLSSGIN